MNVLKVIKTILKKKWIMIMIMIGFIIIQWFNLYEGIVYANGNTNIKKILIQPVSGNDYLHLSELKLYGDNEIIDYDAVSSNGVYDENSYDKLKDSDKNTIFHSYRRNATLTIIPKNNLKITRILIRNRLDCCLDRLRGYNLSIIRNDGSIYFSKNLNELSNLYTYPYMEEILIS
jgi:hypothetical protein